MKLVPIRARAVLKTTAALTALPLAAFAAIAVSASACSGAKSNDVVVNSDGGVVDPTDPPHAVGLIELGEEHSSGGSSVTPIVAAAFAPDSTAAAKSKCTNIVAGCDVPAATPKCNACATDEVCTLDSTCASKCVKVCTASCGSDEECYFATPTSASCRKVEPFNAGALAFAGTTTPLTLFPPYTFSSSDVHGAPFLAGASIEVQGSGAASGAGFDKFDERYTATSFLQTSPTLDKIGRNIVFGAGSIPIGWQPGSDSIVIEIGGPGGVATCKADDSIGHYDLPRAVVQSVTGTNGGTPTLELSVSRQRVETHKSLRTKGQMTTATVQPIAYLTLTTSSTETTSFQGCSTGQSLCNDSCTDTQYSETDCGSCGHACKNGGYCQSGVCSNEQVPDAGPPPPPPPQDSGTLDCTTCSQNAASGVCSSAASACTNNTDCNAFATCLNGCASGDTTCENNCQTAHAAGASVYSNYVNCICSTACPTQCASQCGN